MIRPPLDQVHCPLIIILIVIIILIPPNITGHRTRIPQELLIPNILNIIIKID